MSLFNYKIYNNKIFFSKNKKNLILLVRRSPGELDWIMPLLYSLKRRYNIFTILRNHKALNLIKENKILYDLWRKTSFSYTVEPRLKNIIWRLGYHFLKRIFPNNYFRNKFQNNYYNVAEIKNLIFKNVKKKYELNFDVSAVFEEFLNFSPWISKFQNENKNLKTIHFPHTTNIFSTKKTINKNKNFVSNNYLLLGNSYDNNFWNKKFPKTNIIETGYLKYDKFWLKKIIPKTIKNKEKIILISYAGYEKEKFDYKKYRNQVIDIMEICTKIPKTKTIFKIHPTTKKKELLKILKLYPQKNWELVNDNHLYLTKISDVCVSIYSSASILDFLALKKTPIELWNILKKTKYKSKLKKLNLTYYAKDKNDFQKKITKLLNKNKIGQIQRNIKRNFDKNFFVDGSVKYTEKKILRILNEKV
jgi:hypothetical protein